VELVELLETVPAVHLCGSVLWRVDLPTPQQGLLTSRHAASVHDFRLHVSDTCAAMMVVRYNWWMSSKRAILGEAQLPARQDSQRRPGELRLPILDGNREVAAAALVYNHVAHCL
jgi:hypothetical protein